MAGERGAPQEPEQARSLRSEFALWRVYDAGGPVLTLKVRYHDDVELADWQNGPDVFTALAQAAAHGWQAYDREPGNAPGEYAILHLIRTRGPAATAK